jgi:hypothetical protein
MLSMAHDVHHGVQSVDQTIPFLFIPERLVEPVLKIPNAAFRFVPFDTVTFLNFAQQNVPFSGDLIELVVGQLAPGFLYFSFELFPVTFYSIPSHVGSPKN